jgi:hypothetical protein
MATRWRVLNRRRRRKAQRRVSCLYHVWEEGYYGYQCQRCELFYVYGCAPWDAPGDHEPGDYDDDPYDDYEFEDHEGDCGFCGGDGWVDGYEDDPIFYDPDELIRCASCNGSGLRKDMTIW